MTAREPILRARGIARRFGARAALEPTDLALAAGETVALVGPNGAGKSTLLSLLAGALRPSAGVVERSDGVRVGWVPQRPAYYDRLTARENLELFARLEGADEPRAVAEKLLTEFELPADDRASAALSVGNRQRLNLALALIGDPRVLLLDEPTASLDPAQRRRLWERVAALPEEGGTVCFATQDEEEVARFAERVLVLRDGRLVFDGGVDEYERLHADEVYT